MSKFYPRVTYKTKPVISRGGWDSRFNSVYKRFMWCGGGGSSKDSERQGLLITIGGSRIALWNGGDGYLRNFSRTLDQDDSFTPFWW